MLILLGQVDREPSELLQMASSMCSFLIGIFSALFFLLKCNFTLNASWRRGKDGGSGLMLDWSDWQVHAYAGPKQLRFPGLNACAEKKKKALHFMGIWSHDFKLHLLKLLIYTTNKITSLCFYSFLYIVLRWLTFVLSYRYETAHP